MAEEFYIKESDVIKAMENNSHKVEVFGTQRKMIDGMLLCYDISELKRVDITEIRNKVIDEFAEKVKSHIEDSMIPKTRTEVLQSINGVVRR